MEGAPLLAIEDLRVSFDTPRGPALAVDSVSLRVREAEVVGLVGESGSGKTLTALSVLRLLPPPGRIAGGRVLFRGEDLLRLPEPAMHRLRGDAVSMVFQEPMTALNPVLTCGSQVEEVLRLHRGLGRRAARAEAEEMLRLVGIPDPEARARDYPHRLSGGMRQRVLLAAALACRPALLLADEPTTALDVTIQAQVLRLILSLKERFGMAVLLITHDLGVVAETTDRIAVLYAGEIVEEGDAEEILRAPRHPYTRALLRSAPRSGPRGARLSALEGSVPALGSFPAACRFRGRCPIAEERCAGAHPELEGGVRCFLAREERT
jgi:oligopeptide/dipeptide ABC transporter ATP-binding protein